MKNIFIDLGCFDGDTIRQFYGWKFLAGQDEWEIHAFDPNPNFKKNWGSMMSENDKLKFYNIAVSDSTGETEFTLRPEDQPYGSTITKQRDNWGQGEIITVQTIDFSTWLKQFAKHRVIVKMDIEGAEFEVLEKMIKDKTDYIPELIMVEWHNSKRSDNDPDRQARIIDQLHCEVSPWL
jgi:FkbM family methyltransferase